MTTTNSEETPIGQASFTPRAQLPSKHIQINPALAGGVQLTGVNATLVAVGPAEAEAAMAGVAGLRERGGGVDGVATATQGVGGIQELRVGHGLRTHEQTVDGGARGNVPFEAPTLPLRDLLTFPSAPSSTPSRPITISLALTPPEG